MSNAWSRSPCAAADESHHTVMVDGARRNGRRAEGAAALRDSAGAAFSQKLNLQLSKLCSWVKSTQDQLEENGILWEGPHI